MTQLHTFSRDSSFPVQSRHEICQGIRLSSFSAVLAVGNQANRRTHNAAQEAGTVRTWGTLCTEARARHRKAKINQESHHPLLRTLLLHAFSPHELLQPWQSGLTKCTTRKGSLWLTPHQKDLSGHSMARPRELNCLGRCLTSLNSIYWTWATSAKRTVSFCSFCSVSIHAWGKFARACYKPQGMRAVTLQ